VGGFASKIPAKINGRMSARSLFEQAWRLMAGWIITGG
jgi:hypothetical protein